MVVIVVVFVACVDYSLEATRQTCDYQTKYAYPDEIIMCALSWDEICTMHELLMEVVVYYLEFDICALLYRNQRMFLDQLKTLYFQ